MSGRKAVVEQYFDGFRRSDHKQILDLLTEDVVWDLPGFKHLAGDLIGRVESYIVPLP